MPCPSSCREPTSYGNIPMLSMWQFDANSGQKNEYISTLNAAPNNQIVLCQSKCEIYLLTNSLTVV